MFRSRVASNRNQTRRSVSSIQFSMQAGGGDVLVLVAEIVRLAQAADEILVVVAQLGQHVLRRHVVGVVVLDALQARDLADGVQRGAADLADALGHRVGHGEDLIALLVEQQVVVAEMRAAHVPVEVLGLEVDGEGVGEQRVERAGQIADGIGVVDARCLQRRFAALGSFAHIAHGESPRPLVPSSICDASYANAHTSVASRLMAG